MSDINNDVKYHLDNTKRKHIHSGSKVDIVLKKDQKLGKLTSGYVKDILTNKQNHPRGIKVRLDNNQVGRVQKIYNNYNNINNKFLINLNQLLFSPEFKNIPLCLVLPNYVYYQNTRDPDPAVKNIINYIYNHNLDKNLNIHTIRGFIPEDKSLDINIIREKLSKLGNLLKQLHISFFVVSKGASMTSNNNDNLIRKIREEQIRWEKENHFD